MQHAELGAIGTTFRRAGQAGLFYYTLTAPGEVQALHRACGFAQSVYLATCNRVEVFFVAEASEAVATCRARLHAFFAQHRPEHQAVFDDARKLTAYAGEGALEHLFVVAAALDSMVPGEAQILGQVKAALREASQSGLVGPALSDAFAEAFAVAKQVRERTALGRGRVSMFSLAASLIEARARQARGQRLTFAVVGVGKMAEAAGRWAQRRSDVALTFVNRTPARAQALAARYGGNAVALAQFLSAPGRCEVVLCATASPVPLIDAEVMSKLAPGALLLDLAVARDVVHADAQALGCEAWDIDRLQAVAAQQAVARRAQVAHAREHIDQALERYRIKALQRGLSAALLRFRQGAQTVLDAEAKLVSGNAGEGNEEIRAFGQRLLGRWLHGPTIALKQLGQQCGLEAVEAFVAASDGTPSMSAHEQIAGGREVPKLDRP